MCDLNRASSFLNIAKESQDDVFNRLLVHFPEEVISTGIYYHKLCLRQYEVTSGQKKSRIPKEAAVEENIENENFTYDIAINVNTESPINVSDERSAVIEYLPSNFQTFWQANSMIILTIVFLKMY